MKALLTASVICISSASVLAQGTVYVSNLGEVTAGFSVGGNQSFETGAAINGYALNSVTLLMGDYIPGVNSFAVAIYSDNNGQAGAPIGELTGNSDPESAGEYMYMAPNIVLSPTTTYWIVTTYNSGLYERGAYSWQYTSSPNYISANSWSIGSASITSIFPPVDNNQWLQFSLNATPIPEPPTFAFSCLALGLALAWYSKGQPPAK